MDYDSFQRENLNTSRTNDFHSSKFYESVISSSDVAESLARNENEENDPSNPESGADVLGTKYLLNGSEISKADAIAIADEKKMESTASPVYNINFKNIISIG